MSEDLFNRKKLKCKCCRVTACLVCESKGIISNMRRIGNKFKCNTCGSEILIDKIEG